VSVCTSKIHVTAVGLFTVGVLAFRLMSLSSINFPVSSIDSTRVVQALSEESRSPMYVS